MLHNHAQLFPMERFVLHIRLIYKLYTPTIGISHPNYSSGTSITCSHRWELRLLSKTIRISSPRKREIARYLAVTIIIDA